jgi:hypothetical protein
MLCARIAAGVCYNCYITRYARAYQRPRDVILTMREVQCAGVRSYILHLTGYNVSDAVHTPLA